MEPTERQVKEQISKRLAQRLPDVGPDVIERELDAAFRRYDGALVRNFLPILVEREVVERARGETGSMPIP